MFELKSVSMDSNFVSIDLDGLKNIYALSVMIGAWEDAGGSW